MLELEEYSIKSNKSPSTIENIDKIKTESFTYNDFFQKYIKNNVPVVITGLTNNWECTQKWLHKDNSCNNEWTINFDYLKNKIPIDTLVPVVDCSDVKNNEQKKLEMNFHEYLEQWQNKCPKKASMFYLKDWHLRKLLPNYKFYQVPSYFASDWLNEYLTQTDQDDYQFVYMGKIGTWTPFHADVFSSFSWSTNLLGQKKWLILLPGEELKLSTQLQKLPFSVDELSLDGSSVKYFTIYQNAGETIFIPSGWYHQVFNITDTISINHNWFNGANLSHIWSVLWEEYLMVLKELDDCKDMDEFLTHCQLVLKSSHGMDFNDFLCILEFIGKTRLFCLLKCTEATDTRLSFRHNWHNYQFGKHHCEFDLIAIVKVLKIINTSCFEYENLCKRCNLLLNMIESPPRND